jgi:hypothetical protein
VPNLGPTQCRALLRTICAVSRIRVRRPMLSPFLAIASMCFVFLAVAACSDPTGRNIRDCSQWRTESIPGCYDGQGGGDMN